MMTVDENKSWYIEENIEMFSPLVPRVAMANEEFTESNLMAGMCLKWFLIGKF